MCYFVTILYCHTEKEQECLRGLSHFCRENVEKRKDKEKLKKAEVKIKKLEQNKNFERQLEKKPLKYEIGFPSGSAGKESPAGDTGGTDFIFGSERPSGGGHGHPLQYACLKNPMYRGAWWATVPKGLKESDTPE